MSPEIRKEGGEYYLYRRYKKGGGVDRILLGEGGKRQYLSEAAGVLGVPLARVEKGLESRRQILWGDDLNKEEMETKEMQEKGEERNPLKINGNFSISPEGEIVLNGKILKRE